MAHPAQTQKTRLRKRQKTGLRRALAQTFPDAHTRVNFKKDTAIVRFPNGTKRVMNVRDIVRL